MPLNIGHVFGCEFGARELSEAKTIAWRLDTPVYALMVNLELVAAHRCEVGNRSVQFDAALVHVPIFHDGEGIIVTMRAASIEAHEIFQLVIVPVEAFTAEHHDEPDVVGRKVCAPDLCFELDRIFEHTCTRGEHAVPEFPAEPVF